MTRLLLFISVLSRTIPTAIFISSYMPPSLTSSPSLHPLLQPHSMFSVSTAVLIARYKALGDQQATGRTLFTAMASSLTLGIFFTVLMASRPAAALRLMGASSPEMISLGAPYLLWRATALPANMFLLVAGGAFRGIGNARENFTNGLVVGLINLVLDPLLMFKFGLGVKGRWEGGREGGRCSL